ncbi:MAG TPA: hypothetical protein VMT55_03640, partial [Candidatus Sulfotelmatobacter sp.]|nr:hypothetical protein [Candidatus Sulfotelmatobacter sp.]
MKYHTNKILLYAVNFFIVSLLFAVVLFTGISTKLFSKNVFAAGDPAPVTKKVLVLDFDPYVSGTTPLTTYENWNNPVT